MDFQKKILKKLRSKRRDTGYDVYLDACFILSKEFGWSYEEIKNTPSPVVLALLQRLEKFYIQQAKQMKKAK